LVAVSLSVRCMIYISSTHYHLSLSLLLLSNVRLTINSAYMIVITLSPSQSSPLIIMTDVIELVLCCVFAVNNVKLCPLDPHEYQLWSASWVNRGVHLFLHCVMFSNTAFGMSLLFRCSTSHQSDLIWFVAYSVSLIVRSFFLSRSVLTTNPSPAVVVLPESILLSNTTVLLFWMDLKFCDYLQMYHCDANVIISAEFAHIISIINVIALVLKYVYFQAPFSLRTT
jgi:hypothetical protein